MTNLAYRSTLHVMRNHALEWNRLRNKSPRSVYLRMATQHLRDAIYFRQALKGERLVRARNRQPAKRPKSIKLPGNMLTIPINREED